MSNLFGYRSILGNPVNPGVVSIGAEAGALLVQDFV